MIKISIETIPHENQRYPTVGDWWIREEHTAGIFMGITVSDMKNMDYEFLVAVHELIEAYLCDKRKIDQDAVTRFDMDWESRYLEGIVKSYEPGNDSSAPYYKEHQFATIVERMIAYELGINWQQYDKTVNEL